MDAPNALLSKVFWVELVTTKSLAADGTKRKKEDSLRADDVN